MSEEYRGMVDDLLRRTIADMLTEDTGTHFLDSGGAYGRHWQRNQHVEDWDNTPPLHVEAWDDDDYIITLNVYHFLTDILGFSEETARLEEEFKEFTKDSDKPWYTDMVEFAEHKGWDNYKGNTYNGDCALSQTLQFIVYPDKGIVHLQIHGGADVRGGYTRPRFFQMEDEYSILRYNDIYADCLKCGERWFTDDGGYNWYNDMGLEFTSLLIHKQCGGQIVFEYGLNSQFSAPPPYENVRCTAELCSNGECICELDEPRNSYCELCTEEVTFSTGECNHCQRTYCDEHEGKAVDDTRLCEDCLYICKCNDRGSWFPLGTAFICGDCQLGIEEPTDEMIDYMAGED